MQLNMGTPMDVGLTRADGDTDMFDLNLVDGKGKAKALSQGAGLEMGESADEAEFDLGTEDEEDLPSDEEDRRLHLLEGNMDNLYDQFQNRRLERDAKQKARASRMKKHISEGGEFQGIGENPEESEEDEENSADEIVKLPASDSSEDEEENEDDGVKPIAVAGQKRSRNGKLINDLKDEDTVAVQKERAAAIWYDQKVFKGIKGLDALLQADESEEEVEEAVVQTKGKKSIAQMSNDVSLRWRK